MEEKDAMELVIDMLKKSRMEEYEGLADFALLCMMMPLIHPFFG